MRNTRAALWVAAAFSLVAAIAASVLANRAGAASADVSWRDLAALPHSARITLIVAAAVLVAADVLLIWSAARVSRRLRELLQYTQGLKAGEAERTCALVGSQDEFGTIAENFESAARDFAKIAGAVGELEAVRDSIKELRRSIDLAIAGDRDARAATTNSHLAELAISLNALLARVAVADQNRAKFSTSASEILRSAQPLLQNLTRLELEAAGAEEMLRRLKKTVDQLHTVIEVPTQKTADHLAGSGTGATAAAVAWP